MEEFDKEKALIFLNRGNLPKRKISRIKVEQFKETLLTGKFNEDVCSPIHVFKGDSSLINGNHRLTALSETDKKIRLLVVYTDDPNVVHYIDIGANRTPSHALQVAGLSDKQSAKVASMIRTMAIIFGFQSQQSITRSDYFVINSKWPELQESLSRWDNDSTVPSRFILPFDIVLREMGETERADQVYRALMGEIRIYEGDPIWRIQEFFQYRNMKQLKYSDGAVIYTIMQSWLDLLDGKVYKNKMKKLPVFREKPSFEGFDKNFLLTREREGGK